MKQTLEGFNIIGNITNIEIIAVSNSIKILPYLNKTYGKGRWRKLKGMTTVERISTRHIRLAELHWFEAHGIGKKQMKIKRWLD